MIPRSKYSSPPAPSVPPTVATQSHFRPSSSSFTHATRETKTASPKFRFATICSTSARLSSSLGPPMSPRAAAVPAAAGRGEREPREKNGYGSAAISSRRAS